MQNVLFMEVAESISKLFSHVKDYRLWYRSNATLPGLISFK